MKLHMKATDEIAGMCVHFVLSKHHGLKERALANAFNGSAAVFEALLAVDTKYTKFADKEYDSISTEVKKSFKKLGVSALHNLGVH